MRSSNLRFLLTIAFPLYLITAALLFIIAFVAGLGSLVSILAGVILGFAPLVLLRALSDKIFISLTNARPVNHKKDTRFISQIEHLCLAHGFVKPRLLIIKSNNLAAVAFGTNPQSSSIAITIGLQKNLAPTELQSILAHELSRIRQGITRRETLAAIYLRLIFRRLANPLYRSVVHTNIATQADVESVKLTRYPPGLISALGKLTDPTTVNPQIKSLEVSHKAQERAMVLGEMI